jgi:hypothetical protein
MSPAFAAVLVLQSVEWTPNGGTDVWIASKTPTDAEAEAEAEADLFNAFGYQVAMWS